MATFLSKQETRQFILSDSDGYFGSFSFSDLYARKVLSVDDYKRSIVTATFSTAVKKRIRKLCAFIDRYLPAVISKIPWTFALTVGNSYENGFPHTRKNVIFLSTGCLSQTINEFLRILIHEKMHVYQRFYGPQVDAQLKNLGFIAHNGALRNVRANPDLNKIIYSHKDYGLMATVYNSDRPANLSDVTTLATINDVKYEHPYELMAYEVSEALTQLIVESNLIPATASFAAGGAIIRVR
jgi:hypothetical protein